MATESIPNYSPCDIALSIKIHGVFVVNFKPNIYTLFQVRQEIFQKALTSLICKARVIVLTAVVRQEGYEVG